MNKLHEVRKNKNKTIDQIAKKFNVSNGYISLLEHGDRKPSYELLNDMINYFGPEIVLDYLPALQKHLREE